MSFLTNTGTGKTYNLFSSLMLQGSTCQSGQGQCRKRWCTISQESSQLTRIFVLDTENLCSISISEEMGPGEACVISHLSWVAVPRLQLLVHSITLLAFDVKPLHFVISHKPNSKTFPHIACSWFLFKMVMIILFWNINGSTFGGWSGGQEGEAFAIHISVHDYIKSMFCHIW